MKYIHDIKLPEESLTYTKRPLRKDQEARNRTVRLRMNTEEFMKLESASEDLDKSKTQIVREALEMYYEYWLN